MQALPYYMIAKQRCATRRRDKSGREPLALRKYHSHNGGIL
jgi:hypothetical protein